jgi:hypothetical protein
MTLNYAKVYANHFRLISEFKLLINKFVKLNDTLIYTFLLDFKMSIIKW